MSLATSWSSELRLELRDFNKFLSLCTVFDKVKGKVVPFVPTVAQKKLIEVLKANNRIVILKARQIGASTIVRAWFSWKALMADEPIKIGIMSYTHESATYLHGLDKGFIGNLPSSISRRVESDTARTIRLKDTQVELKSFTAGMKGGGTRSFTMTDLHLSEFAHYDDQQEVLSNAVSSVGDTGQIVIETTANGPGDKYHDLVQNVGSNGWALFWSPWYEHEDYKKHSMFGQQAVPHMTQAELIYQKRYSLNKAQMYWRHTMISSLGADKFMQEYPSTPEEAFISCSKLWLKPSAFDNIEIVASAGKELLVTTSEQLEEDDLVLGVDISNGVGGDYTTITAVSIRTAQPIWHWHDNTESPGLFTERLLRFIKKYRVKKVLVESNAIGGIVIQRLKDLGVDKNLLWRDENGKDWITAKHSKMKIFEDLRSLIESGSIKMLALPVYKELLALEATKFGPRGQKHAHDDLAVSLALAYACLESVPNSLRQEKSLKTMEAFIRKQKVNKTLTGDKLPWKRSTLNGRV